MRFSAVWETGGCFRDGSGGEVLLRGMVTKKGGGAGEDGL